MASALRFLDCLLDVPASPLPTLPMLHSSRRPTTTYARRKSRGKLQDVSRDPNIPTSPLEELSPSVQDMPLSEMSRRMKKRSRLVLSTSQENIERCTTESSVKKSKASGSRQGHRQEHPSVPCTPLSSPDTPFLPLRSEHMDDSIFSTPDVSVRLGHQPQSPEVPDTQDRLSPIPVARRMLSRTGSRNLKENSSRGWKRDLASPFSSRPSSRSSSPFRIPKAALRSGSHSKARTLSSDLQKKTKACDITRSKALEFDSILDTTYTSAPMTVAQASQHVRTASIPSLTPSLLDGISPESWLVPPRALSRSPTALFDDMHLDTFQAEHPSFYFDIPVKNSTPPRKRSTTITQKSFAAQQISQHRDSMVPLQGMSETGEDMLSDVKSATFHHPRRRRRTVVHMSSDSIFSSALDFSAYTIDPTQTKQQGSPLPARVHSSLPSTIMNEQAAIVPTLDSAFSPAAVNTTLGDLEHKHDSCPTAPVSPAPPPCLSLPSVLAVTPSVSPSSSPCRAQALSTPYRVSSSDLHGLLTSLNLDGKSDASATSPDDSGVVITDSTSTVSRTDDQVQRRRRGDTIRASDFSRASGSVNSVVNRSRTGSPVQLPANPNRTRRTRSGTVTLANAPVQPIMSHPIEVLVTDAPGLRKAPTKAKSNLRGTGRSRLGHARAPATIVMKIEDEPLPPQGSDSEDDELLLTGQKWKDPVEDA